MNSSEEHMDLVSRYFGGQATTEEVSRLEDRMLEDAQLRADFLAYARVDAALPRAIGGDSQLVAVEPEVTPAQSRRSWFRWEPVAAAAAVLLFGWVIWSGSWSSRESNGETQEVARFGELRGCRWVSSEARIESGEAIHIGQRIELSAGSAQVLFGTGARLELVGPAIVETRSEMSVFLTLGEVNLVAEKTESKGFTVETPSSTFVDISTAFTATVSPDGLSRLQVTEGEVDLVLDGIEPQRLREGGTIYVEPGERRIVTRIESGDETVAFRFPTIEPPSRNDYADRALGDATIRVVRGQLRTQATGSGPASVLLDGTGQSKQDAPLQSAFFETGTEGRFLIDLGQPITVSKINSYSWHQHDQIDEHRERARQRFTLYGFSGNELPDLDLPLENAGWTRIARVNSDEFFRLNQRLDRPAQQACSISAAQGEIGRFRYLLWDVKMNSFYGEFDIFGKP